MSETKHIPNADLSPQRVPSPDADFAEVIFPFAMSFSGYGVWGDSQTVRHLAEQTWAQYDSSRTLPDSLTKLRTSLFGAGRYMRMTDFDEDVFGGPGSGARWEAMMRDHVARIARIVSDGSETDSVMAAATFDAAAELLQTPAAKERELRIALARALAAHDAGPVISSATGHEHTFTELPLWTAGPGPLDLIVGTVTAPRIAGEVKLESKNTLSHSLWDVLKLLGALALGAERAYMIAAYPTRVWEHAEFAGLYRHGSLGYTDLPIAKEWPALLVGKGTPLRIPNKVEITDVAQANFWRLGARWQLRSVAVDPALGGWLELNNGQLDGARPYTPSE
jgi:hypothetical protein